MGGASGSTDMGAENGASPSGGASGSAGIGVPQDRSRSDEGRTARGGDEAIGGASGSTGPAGSGGGGSTRGGASASEPSHEEADKDPGSSLPVAGGERDERTRERGGD